MTEVAPLRIAIVYDCLYPYTTGGGERVYAELAARLANAGHAVDFLTRVQWDGPTPTEQPFRVVPIWDGPIADEQGNRLTSSAVRFATQVFTRLRRTRRDYDLVTVSALPPLNVFAARAALGRRGPWLLADWLEVWPARKWREYSGAAVGTVAAVLQALGLRRSDDVSVNSLFTLGRARSRLRAGTGFVLGLVDLAGAPRPASDDVDPGLLLFAGRHIPDKQLTVLPAALAVVRERVPGARLVVTGTGPETPALLEAAEAAGVPVDVRGRVPDDELTALMGRAAVLVNPSRREGFGLVVAEAAASGTPSVVVAGDDNAAVELIDPGVNGFVAASAEPEELADAIVRALEAGPELRASTRAWYAEASVQRSLDVSIAEILDRYASARG
ncbi:glycosyltransferase family 4 protein [Leifsonia sp. ZF2019]|uniref:glycosyltransferase family 4 protein n=1 Tax=Leifsonia sp. ZF2019 TaxID=2781978 RepID=UPI001CBB70B4|nr:glycosyltransferase family 4 protein [Leifsonia sp. ZF2019]UAJ80567.1 glycosyltransferase family 4 protein [Leifsonia sp. ZF2019]